MLGEVENRAGTAAEHRPSEAERQAEDAEAAALVERFQAGDAEAFATLYTRYFDRVYSYLRLLLRNPDEAQDATQQVFLKVFQTLAGYQQRRSFWVWLFVLVRNHAIDELRKRNHLDLEEPAALDRRRSATAEPDLNALDWLTDTDILLFIEHMPLPQRQVLILRYMLDLSNPQIAQILHRTPADVSKLHHRAVAFLRRRLTSLGRAPTNARQPHWRRQPKKAQVLRARRSALLNNAN